MKKKRTLVISGVGMKEGGILTVLRSFVSAAESRLPPEWHIVVLAHRKDLIVANRADVYEYPDIKASWFKRIWFELVSCRGIARREGATVWFAMHDMTPLVSVERQYLYCHNPTPFTRLRLRDLYFDWVFCVHAVFYRWVYALNINRNTEVFVQQAWIREQFKSRFGARNVVVARPYADTQSGPSMVHQKGPLIDWIYPTYPRQFKNIEIIGAALEVLEQKPGWTGRVHITISPDDNRYSRCIHKRFGHLKSLVFIGRQSQDQMSALYRSADALIFSSKLETWGLPISEAKSYGLPMLVADCPYAYESVGSYGQVDFFDPDDPEALADKMLKLSSGQLAFKPVMFDGGVSDIRIEGWNHLVDRICQLV